MNLPAETRAKMSAARMGHVVQEQTRKAMAIGEFKENLR